MNIVIHPPTKFRPLLFLIAVALAVLFANLAYSFPDSSKQQTTYYVMDVSAMEYNVQENTSTLDPVAHQDQTHNNSRPGPTWYQGKINEKIPCPRDALNNYTSNHYLLMNISDITAALKTAFGDNRPNVCEKTASNFDQVQDGIYRFLVDRICPPPPPEHISSLKHIAADLTHAILEQAENVLEKYKEVELEEYLEKSLEKNPEENTSPASAPQTAPGTKGKQESHKHEAK